jgi:hypothetical protein
MSQEAYGIVVRYESLYVQADGMPQKGARGIPQT